MFAVTVDKLTKRYGGAVAVDEVSFEVEVGEVFALLGPNGAGKTSTIEILEGFRVRDSGSVDVLGYDPAKKKTSRAMRERLGVVLQELAVEPFLSVRQVLDRNAGYYPNPRSVDEVIALIGLESKADARVKTLSGGQMRRLDLALGIVGNPELLFLDEPTTGFDPSARRDAWDVVRALTGGGTTVILTTHYMDEAEALADRVAVIANGKIVASGKPREIGGRDVSDATISFRLPAGSDASSLPIPAGTPVSTLESGLIRLHSAKVTPLLRQLTTWSEETGTELIGLSVERLTLEDVYLKLTGYTGSAP